MLKRNLFPLVLLAACGAAQAIPIVAVDADPGVAGIQSSRTVTLGDTFNVLVTIDNAGSGAAGAFDTLTLDLLGDPAFVAAVTTPVGSAAIAGDIVATAPLLALDLYGFTLPAVGDLLAFGGTSGAAIGLTSLGSAFLLPDAGAIGIALFTFTATALGSSVLGPTADAINQGFLLAFSAEPGTSVFVPSMNFGATITVVAPATQVAEPWSLSLLMLGFALLVATRKTRVTASPTVQRM